MAEHGAALGDVLDLLDARLTLALKQAQEDAAVFGAQALAIAPPFAASSPAPPGRCMPDARPGWSTRPA